MFYTCRYITIDASGYRSCLLLFFPRVGRAKVFIFSLSFFSSQEKGKRKKNRFSSCFFLRRIIIGSNLPEIYIYIFSNEMSRFVYRRSRSLVKKKLEYVLWYSWRKGRSSCAMATAAILATTNVGDTGCGVVHRAWIVEMKGSNRVRVEHEEGKGENF